MMLNTRILILSLMLCIVATMNICVVGQGKIGLPLAVAVLQRNLANKVVGIDTNAKVVADLKRGFYPHVLEDNFVKKFQESIASDRLKFGSDYSSVSNANVIVVAVPLKVNPKSLPDYQNLERAFCGVGDRLKQGSLVLLETTVPAGLCQKLIIPILEKTSGLSVGKDFSFAYSPERISSGSFFQDLYRYPKLIGPFDDKSAKMAEEFYSSFLHSEENAGNSPEIRVLSSIETAEFVKLAESIYRDVNIGLANLLSSDCMQSGIDYFEVKESANSQPHSNLHSPGIYVGGHCIPVYPHLYEVSFPNNPFLGLIKSARNINNLIHKSIIDFVLSEVKLRGIKVEKCLILGAAYRGDVKETYDSGVFPIIDYLKNNGIGCVVYDPLFSTEELVDFGLTPVQNTLSETQLVIINSDHRTFMNLRSKDFSKGSIVIDGRNILRPSNFLAGQLFTIGIGWNR